MLKFPLRVSIVAPICCALTGCPPFSTDAPVTTVEAGNQAIPPRSGISPVKGVLDPTTFTLRARPEIIESTSDRVRIEFTTTFSHHIWWL